jgi:hypothetical protein
MIGRLKVTYSAEQEENDGGQTAESTDNGAPENTAGSSHGSVLGLFRHMARGIEADQNPGSGEVGETPVPASRSTGAVIGGHEGLVSRAEAPGLGSANGQPNEVQEEINHDYSSGEPEHPLVQARRHEVQQSSQGQQNLGTDPLNSTKLDAVGVLGEIDIEDGQFGKHIVNRSLGVAGTKGRPGGGTPPRNDESKQPAEARTARLGSPEIDRTG